MNSEVRFIERCPDFWALYNKYCLLAEKFGDNRQKSVVNAGLEMEEHVAGCKVCAGTSLPVLSPIGERRKDN